MGQKRALVTGASGGIGLEFAKRLAREGYSITLVARNENKLRSLVQELGPQHKFIAADLSSQAGIDKVTSEISKEKYSLLINNAGSGVQGAFEKVPIADSKNQLALNCQSLVELTHSFLKTSVSGDAVVNLASTLAFNGFPSMAIYSATKAFVLSFSESVWFEQKPRGVYVMALCPGATHSEFHNTAGFTESTRPPEGIFQTAEQVINTGMKALKKRKCPSVVSGGKNRFMVFFTSVFMSRKGVISLMGKFSQPKT